MRDIGLLILRLGFAGTMFLNHGLGKLLSYSETVNQFPDPLGVGSKFSLIMALFAEVVCSLLVVVGFKTRFAAIPLIVTMLVAFFMIHGQDAFSQKELPFLYLIVFIVLSFTGAGKYSVDRS